MLNKLLSGYASTTNMDHHQPSIVPMVQQSLANGDPDVDAIFRLTRKRQGERMNVTFSSDTDPLVYPAGVFAPSNSQNTLFSYAALWATLIPITTTLGCATSGAATGLNGCCGTSEGSLLLSARLYFTYAIPMTTWMTTWMSQHCTHQLTS